MADICDNCGGFALHKSDCPQVEARGGERGRAAWFGEDVPEDVEEVRS